MTCAGCDDCPADRWHLHVTVRPQRSWSHADVVAALTQDIERYGIKPVVVTNHMRDGTSYRELIPTKHWVGDEASASRELFRMGVLLNNSGWRVRRLKIEGDATRVLAGRALYYEAHVKDPPCPDDRVPRSTNSRGQSIYTVRHPAMGAVYEGALRLYGLDPYDDHAPPIKIEAAVLDTRPELDDEWMGQFHNTGGREP